MIKLAVAALLSMAAFSPAAIVISEVHSTGSSQNSGDLATTYAADFFELYNNGPAAVDITGWKFDDNSYSFAASVALNGVASIPAGGRAIFLESATPTTTIAAFTAAWFGTNPPANLSVGSYTGSGIGLGSGGDAVNIFDSAGAVQAAVSFGAATLGTSFDNTAGVTGTGTYSTASPAPAISTLSVAGTNGAFLSPVGETGSPGAAIPEPASLALLGLGATALLGRRRA